jgi:hypothetical protein
MGKQILARPVTGIKGSQSQDGGRTVRLHKKAAISITKSAVIDSGATFEALTDSAMIGNRKYTIQQLLITFRQAAAANLSASHGTTPAAGYREFFFGIAKPGTSDHPQAAGEEDQVVVGFAYDNTAAYTLQFPNGEYEITYNVPVPDDFDEWMIDNTNGLSVQIHSTDSPAIGQDAAGSPVAILEVEIDCLLVTRRG